MVSVVPDGSGLSGGLWVVVSWFLVVGIVLGAVPGVVLAGVPGLLVVLLVVVGGGWWLVVGGEGWWLVFYGCFCGCFGRGRSTRCPCQHPRRRPTTVGHGGLRKKSIS